MIESIKTRVLVGDDEKELCIDYEADDDMDYVYLDGEHIFTMSHNDNLKELARKITEKW